MPNRLSRDCRTICSARARRAPGVTTVGTIAIACANVANLTLNHLLVRQRELATRAVLGAAIGRIVRLLIVQTALLTAIGGAVGVAIAALVLPSLLDLYNADGRAIVTVGLNWRVLLMSGGMIAGTALLCAVLPAIRLHRAGGRGDALRIAGARISGGRTGEAYSLGAGVAKIGIAVALLCTSGVLVRSLSTVLSVPPGFGAQATFYDDANDAAAGAYPMPSRARFVERMLETCMVPGVMSAGTTQSTFSQSEHGHVPVRRGRHVGQRRPVRDSTHHARLLRRAWCRVEGRAIDMRDRIDSPQVCVVSASFAKQYFPTGGAVGRRVRRAGANIVWMTIVGVAGDVRDTGLVTPPLATLYVPYFRTTPPPRASALWRRRKATLDNPPRLSGRPFGGRTRISESRGSHRSTMCCWKARAPSASARFSSSCSPGRACCSR